ncbi:MAG: hypothetical protein OCC49_17720 [Fibrobacterales bacterium]
MCTYFKFITRSKPPEKSSFIIDSLIKVASFIFPQANPDYDDKIGNVSYWFIECGDEGYPYREIGFDANDNILFKGPNKRNYGYWLDTDMTDDHFENHKDCEEISGKTFEDMWNK